jgi:ornithine carbamoyltransferase
VEFNALQAVLSTVVEYTVIIIILVCKSCLVKHLEENNTCPTCNIVIHQSHPLQYISFDRTMQDIVYKLVPELQKSKLEFCAVKCDNQKYFR